MGHKRYTAERIIGKLRRAEVRAADGKRIAEIVRELEITEQTYYRWRREYGHRKRAVADLTLDKLTLEETAKGNS